MSQLPTYWFNTAAFWDGQCDFTETGTNSSDFLYSIPYVGHEGRIEGLLSHTVCLLVATITCPYARIRETTIGLLGTCCPPLRDCMAHWVRCVYLSCFVRLYISFTGGATL